MRNSVSVFDDLADVFHLRERICLCFSLTLSLLLGRQLNVARQTAITFNFTCLYLELSECKMYPIYLSGTRIKHSERKNYWLERTCGRICGCVQNKTLIFEPTPMLLINRIFFVCDTNCFSYSLSSLIVLDSLARVSCVLRVLFTTNILLKTQF